MIRCLKQIDYEAFTGCRQISVICKAVDPPTFDEYGFAFSEIPEGTNFVYVPEESVEAYLATDWSKMIILPMSESGVEGAVPGRGVCDPADGYKVFGVDGSIKGTVSTPSEVYSFPQGVYIVNGRKIAVR